MKLQSVCLSHAAKSKMVCVRAVVTIGNQMLKIEPTAQHGLAIWTPEVAESFFEAKKFVVCISVTEQNIAMVTTNRVSFVI